jgi:hypothetical protein
MLVQSSATGGMVDEADKAVASAKPTVKPESVLHAILTEPHKFVWMLFGAAAAVALLAAASNGVFPDSWGNRAQTVALSFLDRTGRDALTASEAKLTEAQQKIKDLEAQLSKAQEQASQAGTLLRPFGSLPIEISARLARADHHDVFLNLSVRNISNDELVLALGPTRPRLIIWGVKDFEASALSSGECSADDCFTNPAYKQMGYVLALQRQQRVSMEVRFSVYGLPGTVERLPAMLTRAALRISVRTSDGRQREEDSSIRTD